MHQLSLADAQRLFTEVDGRLFWKERPVSDFNSHKEYARYATTLAGKEAGNPIRNLPGRSHWVINVNHKSYSRAQIIWLLHTGEWPHMKLARKNMVESDDRISNLSLATSSQVGINSRIRKTNTSGIKGVSWHELSKKWVARINIAGKNTYLGVYSNINEAAEVYRKAAIEHYGACVGQLRKDEEPEQQTSDEHSPSDSLSPV